MSLSQLPHPPNTSVFECNEIENKQHRQQVSARINSNAVGLKSALYDFFMKLNLGAVIGPRNDTTIPIMFEGASSLVIRAKTALELALIDNYPGVEAEWDEFVESSAVLTKVTLIETSNLKRQPSSGEFKEVDLADLSVGDSATTEMVKKAIKDTWSQFGSPLAHLTGYIKEKCIDVIFKGSCRAFEISTKTISDLHSEIHQKYQLNAGIRSLFRLDDDGTRAITTEIGKFRDGMKYHLLTMIDKDEAADFEKVTDMAGFFECLKEQRMRSVEDIDKVKNVFQNEGILLEDLMEKGDLAMTHGSLRMIGITQLGLRTAILAIIKLNRV
ncbi:hypothetical protein BDR26DRAFT_808040 [Obelidium mucronatum]|nr:hypothetical protein BDR26DRAFT_808040 [Obelidium mucronatum]